MGVWAPRGQRLPSDTVWASPPLRGPGFVRGNHTPLHGNASALCCFRIERGHCSPSILHGRVMECGGPVPPPRLRWAGRSPTAGQAASTPDSFPQMGRCGDRASLARGAWGLPPVRWRQDTQTDPAAGAGPAEVTLCPPLPLPRGGHGPGDGRSQRAGRRRVGLAPGPGPGSVGQPLLSPSPLGRWGQHGASPGHAGRCVCSAELCPCDVVRKLHLVLVPSCWHTAPNTVNSVCKGGDRVGQVARGANHVVTEVAIMGTL